MKKYLTLLAFLFCQMGFSQIKETSFIQAILDHQQSAWNKGNIDDFMVGYWENDSLLFMGQNGPTYGYNATLKNYKKNYPDKAHMGQLSFSEISMKPLNTDHYFVIGKFFLKRTVGDASGHFTLVFKKINGKWKIISDHSS